MEQEVTPPKTTARQRLWHVTRKVLIWSLVFYLLNVGLKAFGWEGWEKFDVRANQISETWMFNMFRLSPFSLLVDLKSHRSEQTDNPDYHPPANFNGFENRFDNSSSPRYLSKEVSFWSKIKGWVVAFWKKDDGSANWFGRVVAVIALLLALVLPGTTDSKGNKLMKGTGFLPADMILVLFYMSIFALIFILVIKLFLGLRAAIAGLTSSLLGLGAYMKFFVDEVKSETIDHSKKLSPGLLGLFLKKK